MITIQDILDIDNTNLNTYHTSIMVNKPGDRSVGHFDKFYWKDIDYPESKIISYGDLTELTLRSSIDNTPIDEMFLMCRYFGYSDYDNSCMVERSNFKIFMEEYRSLDWIFEVRGGYGTTDIAIALKGLLDPDNEETAQSIIDTLNGLNGYPCIDDEDVSNMEYDAFLESLEDYGIRDFITEAGGKLNLEINDYDKDKAKELILEIDRNLNYPSYMIESGGTCYIDTDRLIEPVTLEQLKPALTDYEVITND